MKIKKVILSILFVFGMIVFFQTNIFAVNNNVLKFTITSNVKEAHPGDEVLYTVKMGPVKNLGSIKFKLDIPDGLKIIEGKEIEGLQSLLNAAKAEYTSTTKTFIVGSSNYTNNNETRLMTFKCRILPNTRGEKKIKLIIDPDNIFDSSRNMNNIAFDTVNIDSKVKVTIPSNEILEDKKILSPDTSDFSNIILWKIIMLFSAVLFIITLIFKIKDLKKNKC